MKAKERRVTTIQKTIFSLSFCVRGVRGVRISYLFVTAVENASVRYSSSCLRGDFPRESIRREYLLQQRLDLGLSRSSRHCEKELPLTIRERETQDIGVL